MSLRLTQALPALLAALSLGGCATGAVLADRTMAPVLDRALQRQAVGVQQQQPVFTLPPVQEAAPAPTAMNAEPSPAVRWLYGSGESAAASIQTYRQLADYGARAAATPPAQSVAMGMPDVEEGVGTASCRTRDGGRKPLAVVFDADETVLLNRGHEYWRSGTGAPFSADSWSQWERDGITQVAPVPGALNTVRALRAAGITPIYNTNRSIENAKGTIAALAAAGFGETVVGEDLFLRGMDSTGSNKDARRARIAERFCVIALVGDNLGDFADAFNARELGIQERRRLAGRGEYAQLWGNGWFLLANPVYGAFDRGTLDEVFPPDARWSPTPGAAPATLNEGTK